MILEEKKPLYDFERFGKMRSAKRRFWGNSATTFLFPVMNPFHFFLILLSTA
jgi:hypothetical protein